MLANGLFKHCLDERETSNHLRKKISQEISQKIQVQMTQVESYPNFTKAYNTLKHMIVENKYQTTLIPTIIHIWKDTPDDCMIKPLTLLYDIPCNTGRSLFEEVNFLDEQQKFIQELIEGYADFTPNSFLDTKNVDNENSIYSIKS